MSQPAKKPRKKRESKYIPAFKLKGKTCADLVAWLEAGQTMVERPADTRLRKHYAAGHNLKHLKLCGPLKASYHRAWCRTARLLELVPHIRMEVAGGKPDKRSMPTFTASLQRIGAINGIIIHRWETGAFILDHPLKRETNPKLFPTDQP